MVETTPTGAGMLKRFGWGALLGLAAGTLLGGLDVLFCARAAAGQLDTMEARLRFALELMALLALTGGLWGLMQAITNAGLLTLVRRLTALTARRGQKEERRLVGWLWALLASPLLAWVCSQIFSGPRAQRLPGRHALALLLGGLGFAAIARAIPLGWSLRDSVQREPSRQRRAAGAAALSAAAVLTVVGLYVIDRRVLPRLYPWFHLSLQALQLLGAYAAFFWLAAAVREPRGGRRRDTLLVAAVILALLGSRELAGSLLRAQVLRGLALEHAGPGATVLRGYLLLRGTRPKRELVPTPGDRGPMPEEPGAAPPPYSGPRLGGRDVFLITVDALRHDRVTPAVMPFVAGLLPRSVVFERAYTQVPHTSFAVATLLTGKPVYALLTLGQEAASHETLPLILRRFRYKTAAFYPPSVFFVERERLKGLEESAYGFEYVKFEYLPGPRRTEQILRFLDEEHPERVFVWAHYLEPHEPYDVHAGGPGPTASDRERYDGEVRAVDDEIRRLYDEVQRRRPGALFIVAADHGEEFGEHGGRYHGTSLYDEQARVPLIFFDAASRPVLRPQRLYRPVGLVDVAPTLLGLLDMEPPLRMRGRDLAPWLLFAAGEPPSAPVYSEIGRRKMVVLDDRKLVCDFAADACQLFDLSRDAGERRNLIDAEPAVAGRLRRHLDRFIAEAQRYEQAARTGPGEVREVLARARMGDRGALPGLLAVLGTPRNADPASTEAAQHGEALVLLGRLVASAQPKEPGAPDPLLTDPALADPATAARLRALLAEARGRNDEVAARWAAVTLLRLRPAAGAEEAAVLETVTALVEDPGAPPAQRLAGALSLLASPRCQPAARKGIDGGARLDCVGSALKALPAAVSLDDPDEVRPLLLLLGRSGDARAVAGLLPQLVVVRARADVVTALGLLGRAEAVPELERLLLEDPYVPVRAAAATALGRIGGPGAREALSTGHARERELQVRTAIAAALGRR